GGCRGRRAGELRAGVVGPARERGRGRRPGVGGGRRSRRARVPAQRRVAGRYRRGRRGRTRRSRTGVARGGDVRGMAGRRRARRLDGSRSGATARGGRNRAGKARAGGDTAPQGPRSRPEPARSPAVRWEPCPPRTTTTPCTAARTGLRRPPIAV